MKLRKLIFFLFLLFSFNLSSAIEFEELETVKGIPFWFVKDSSLPLVSLSFSFKGGSFLDPKDKEGSTNLMVSLLDEGTENFSGNNFKLSLKENGTKISFSVEKDKIDGTFQVVSSQVQEGFWLLSESINKPLFNSEEIKKVKNQIQASIKIDKSNIQTQVSERFNNNFFVNSKLSRKVKGSEESVQKISRKDLLNMHKANFTRDNLVIGLAGDIDADSAKKYIDFVFGELPLLGKKRQIPKFDTLKKGQIIFEMESPQSTVIFGQRGVSRNDKDYFSIRVLNYVLGGGGFQSRLYKEVREKSGLVYSIYSYLVPYQNDGVIVGGFQTRNETVNETIAKVKEQWERIKNDGINPRELRDAQTYYKGSFSRNFTSTISLASLLKIVQYYELGNDYFKKRSEIIDNLKVKNINDLAAKLFEKNDLFFMIVGKPDI